MKKQTANSLFFFFSIISFSALLFNCDLNNFSNKVEQTPSPVEERTLSPSPSLTPAPIQTPVANNDSLKGYWKSSVGDGFEIVESSSNLYYQYDDETKSVSFAGTIVNEPDFSAASGYITIQITEAGSWAKAVGEYFVIHWKNRIDNSVQQASAYKYGGESSMATQALAEAEFTVENGYFGYYGDYEQQETNVSAPYPSVFLDVYPLNSTISFDSDTKEAVIYTGISSDQSAIEPDVWIESKEIIFDHPGHFRIFTFARKENLEDSFIFSRIMTVADQFCPEAGQAGSDALSMDDSSIVAWATGYENYIFGEDCDVQWQTPEKALGPAKGDSNDIVCLGNGGQITLTFSTPIINGEGPDFVIFENGFSDTFLELAYVEVSSNGTDFVRFDSCSLTESPVSAYGTVQPTAIHGLAGKYKQGFGTPFDLEDLQYKQRVRDNLVDLSSITHVRLIDIWGNPESGISDYDSFNNIIYDPYKCVGAGGFDLEAIGVIHQE